MSDPLASYAVSDDTSRGRRIREDPPRYRGEFQRDRDRIIHSTAFRRLIYKTQVFVYYEGDLYRTRLTHSIEVAQIARTLARALRLNEDLVEAISLAHDLGHTPFGHAGQDALNECMRAYGGFEHNLQSLRVVDKLERRYAEFRGLNLCFETREGILKHCSLSNARLLGDVGRRFIERKQPSLEAQITNIADEIAYNNHDVDDGLRSGLITLDQLNEVPFFAERSREVEERYGALEERLFGREVVRRMIDSLVTDLYTTSQDRIESANLATLEDVREAPAPLVTFSPEFVEAQQAMKQFLRSHLYAHARVREMTDRARAIVQALFDAFMQDNARLPPEHAELAQREHVRAGEAAAARVIADYIAGMTDRYAIQSHERVAG
jgi:dGTPase